MLSLMQGLQDRGDATQLSLSRGLHPRCVSNTPSPSPRSVLQDIPSPPFVRESEQWRIQFQSFNIEYKRRFGQETHEKNSR